MSDSVAVVLCCAEDNEVALVQVVDALHRDGLAPEVVTGVDLDATVLSDAVDRTSGPAVFVLCQSQELDRFQIRRLGGLFSARKGPRQALVTVQLNAARPMAVLPHIRDAAKEVGRTRRPSQEPSEPHLRDVVGPTDVAAIKRQGGAAAVADDPEAIARQLASQLAETEAVLERRARDAEARGGPARRPSPPKTRRPTTDPDRAASGARAASGRAALGGAAATAAAARAQPPDEERPSPSPVTEETDPGEDTPPAGTIDPTPAAASTMAGGPPRPQLGGWLLLGAGVLAISALVAATVSNLQDEPDPVPRGRVEQGRKARAVPAAAGGATAAPAHNPQKSATPTKASVRPPPPPPPTAKGPAADSPEDPGPKPTKAAPPSPPMDEATAIAAAIAEGRMRALDLMLVTTPGTESMPWNEAMSRCRNQRVKGVVKGFRLPNKSELRKLRRARLLPKGAWWSSTEAQGADDEVHVLDGGRFVVWLKVEPNGRAVCVRKR